MMALRLSWVISTDFSREAVRIVYVKLRPRYAVFSFTRTETDISSPGPPCMGSISNQGSAFSPAAVSICQASSVEKRSCVLPAAGCNVGGLHVIVSRGWRGLTGSTLGSELQAVRSHIAADKIGGQNLKMRIMTIVF